MFAGVSYVAIRPTPQSTRVWSTVAWTTNQAIRPTCADGFCSYYGSAYFGYDSYVDSCSDFCSVFCPSVAVLLVHAHAPSPVCDELPSPAHAVLSALAHFSVGVRTPTMQGYSTAMHRSQVLKTVKVGLFLLEMEHIMPLSDVTILTRTQVVKCRKCHWRSTPSEKQRDVVARDVCIQHPSQKPNNSHKRWGKKKKKKKSP